VILKADPNTSLELADSLLNGGVAVDAEQWIGVLLVVIGAYFCLCAFFFPSFFLYRLKAAQAASVFGDKVADRFFGGLGVVMLFAGSLKAIGLF